MPHFAPRPNTTTPTVFKMIPRSIQTDRSRIYSISKTIFSSGFRSYPPFTCASPVSPGFTFSRLLNHVCRSQTPYRSTHAQGAIRLYSARPSGYSRAAVTRLASSCAETCRAVEEIYHDINAADNDRREHSRDSVNRNISSFLHITLYHYSTDLSSFSQKLTSTFFNIFRSDR